MISMAQECDRNDLIDLWREAFAEEPYAVYFYNIVSFQDIIVWRENGHPVSMLHMLPCSFCFGDKTYQGGYLYALATSAVYRKKGIMGKLIHAAKERAVKSDCDFLCLAAAAPSLCAYYETFGFGRTDGNRECAVLEFLPHIQKYVQWERMQEEKTENTSEKEDFMENQMVCGLKEIPFCKFYGEIPY